MAQQSLYNEFMQIPIITRIYTTACVLTTLLVQLDVVSPFQIYFNHELILNRLQLWRLFTSFFFFGYVGFNFLFNMIFIYRYSRMLEEGSFRGRTADFAYMFIIGGLSTAICGCFTQLFFLGQALTLMFVYVWSRRNPFIHLNFLGILTFKAPYLPWVLLGFSLLLGGSVVVDLVGIAVGHVYYFLEDVFPYQPGGQRLLKTPSLLKWIFEGTVDPAYAVPPEERPGGFNWGNQENQNDQQPVD